jgi:hypothetical protein
MLDTYVESLPKKAVKEQWFQAFRETAFWYGYCLNGIIYKIAIAVKESSMKKTVPIALVLLIGIALAFPQPGYSWGHRWYGPGAVVGAGAAVVGAGAALLGAAVGGPGYGYYGSPPAYGYPAPAYVYGYPYYGPRDYSGYGYHGYYGGRGYYGHRR